MTQTRAHIRTVSDSSIAVGWSGHRTITIDRTEQAGGSGLGYSGGELLLLAIGACYCNDLFREAANAGIAIQSVTIDVQCTWGGEPVVGQNVAVAVEVTAESSEEEILALIQHTDRVAEVPNSLRSATAVTISDVRAVAIAAQPDARHNTGLPRPDAQLEMLAADHASGSICALLTPAIKARLRELNAGQVLEVRVDDASAREDITAWCRLAGHELLAISDDTPAYTRYFLRKSTR